MSDWHFSGQRCSTKSIFTKKLQPEWIKTPLKIYYSKYYPYSHIHSYFLLNYSVYSNLVVIFFSFCWLTKNWHSMIIMATLFESNIYHQITTSTRKLNQKQCVSVPFLLLNTSITIILLFKMWSISNDPPLAIVVSVWPC